MCCRTTTPAPLDKQRLGQLIDLVSNILVGDEDARSRDVLGRVYEYFLSQFANAEGKKGGEFYRPRCVVKVLVEMLEPYRGRVYDPCCGSSGMFVQSIAFIRAHASGNGNGGKARNDISIYGQESNYTTRRLAKMNLAIRGIEGQIAHGDSFHNDRHPDLRADFILANPPFNVSDWGGERLADDKRWRYGVPPRATPTSPGCSTWCTTSHRPASRGSCSPTGFCKSAPLDEVRRHGHVLTPGRYVGAEPQPDDGEPFEAKVRRLVGELQAQQAEGARLDAAIAENLKALGFPPTGDTGR